MKKLFFFLLVLTGISFGQPVLKIENPWVRAVPPTAKNSALFMVIKNEGSEPDVLVGVKSDVAKMVSIHRTVNKDGVMKMVHTDHIKIPAGSKVELKPGGYHIMLMGLKRPVKEGDLLDFTLLFKKSGEIKIKAPVKMK